MSRRFRPAVDMRSAEGKAGLRQRLAERAIAKADETPRLFLPLLQVPQVADRLKEGRRG